MLEWVKDLPFQLILGVLAFLSLLSGIFLLFKPARAIVIQQKFYTMINWKIEPISMAKEVRNTRIMGLIFIAIALATATLLIMNPNFNPGPQSITIAT